MLPDGFGRMAPPKKINAVRKCIRFWVEHAHENLISQTSLVKIVKHAWREEIKPNPT